MELAAGTWHYRVTNVGPGKLRFKVKLQGKLVLRGIPDPLRTGPGWTSLVSRNKITPGTLEGDFTLDENCVVKFIFSRGLGTQRTTFRCRVRPVSLS